MTERTRKASARKAANEYALAPNGSASTYGLVAASVLVVLLMSWGSFYDVSFLPFSAMVGAAVAASFAAGVVLRIRRSRAHDTAYRAEYDRTN